MASYRIVATLDAEHHEVVGAETIRWQNPSRTPTSELFLHAYLNAFSHRNTRFLRAGAARARSASSLSTPGALVLTKFVARELGGADLLASVGVHTPSDPNDATDLRVTLPGAIAPGELLTLEVEFRARLPNLIERAGYVGNFHAIAQWFPKIARRDAAGTWHHFAYEPLAEFSSDFGDYDVTLDVPAGFVIAAPGLSSVEATSTNRRRERYQVKGVHDFAWFTWDRFEASTAMAGATEVRLFASSEQAANVALTLDLVRWGLDFFGARYGSYPFASLTVVHPPDRAHAAGGMEYPQLIATGGPWYFSRLGLRVNEAVLLHELAHQWFYGIVASDEYRYPVLDEGLTSWAEATSLRERFGAGSFLRTPFLQISEAAVRREIARKYTRRGPLGLPASEFGDFASLSGRVYARFATLLETLTRVYGEATVARALLDFAVRFRFSHPTLDDFMETLRPHLPPRAMQAMSTALLDDGWVDFAIREVTAKPSSTRDGFDNRILVERRGTLDFPVQLEVEFADGHVARRHLDSIVGSTWIEWSHVSPIVAASLDPEHRITIDDDLENQTRRVNAPPRPTRLAVALHLLVAGILSLGWP